MARYEGSKPALTAIAQHYGIPTPLLDLTTSPEIALLFSKQSGEIGGLGDHSVIYCFSKNDLQSSSDFRLLEIDVDNLWRLEAQGGLFLEFLSEGVGEIIRGVATRIHFPTIQLTEAESLRLYPLRKSPLESVIDQWLFRQEIQGLYRSVQELNEIKHFAEIRRQTYPGAYRWRQIPELDIEWINNDHRWLIQNLESVAITNDQIKILIPRVDLSSPQGASQSILNSIEYPIRQGLSSGKLITFIVQLSPGAKGPSKSISTLLNRCWDGLRVLPYSLNEVMECIALTAAFLCARAEGVDDVDNWPETLWGDVELVDISPIGGHLDAGLVSKASLELAYSRHTNGLAKWMRKRLETDPRSLMTYVVDPWLIFDFVRFKSMFVKEFIPTAVDGYWCEDLNIHDGRLGCMWSISFNPALLGFVTNSDYRFKSPLAMERNIDQIIFVTPQMERDDLEEIFCSCLPSIFNGGSPYQVKFTDYSDDDPEIWLIERAIQQCKWIVEVSGISVLELSSAIKEQDGTKVDLLPGGFGAFEIWLISRRLLEAMNRTVIDVKASLFKEFLSQLRTSNRDLEARTRAIPDCPIGHSY